MPIEYDMTDGPIGPADSTESAPADAPLDDVPEASATSADEIGSDKPIVDDEPLPGSEAPADAALELAETAKVKIGKREVVLKDLLEAELRHADYTRKTTELARERDEMADFRLDKELGDIQTDDFVSRMSNPTEIFHEFSTHQPEAFEQLIDMIIDREIKLQSLSKEGRELYLRDEKEARARWQQARDARVQKAFDTHRGRHTARREAAKSHGTWRNEAMKSCGLDPSNDAHHDLVMDGMASPRNKGKAWNKELFDAESARVAKYLGAKAPKPAAVAKPAPVAPVAKPAPVKPALPPVRAQGAAPPAAARGAGGKFAPKSTSYEDFWENVRNG